MHKKTPDRTPSTDTTILFAALGVLAVIVLISVAFAIMSTFDARSANPGIGVDMNTAAPTR